MQTLARRARASYVTPLLCNRKLMPRIVTLAFNEAILLHLLLLGALVCACMASEIDHLAGMPGLRLGLSALALGIRPAKDYLFQVLITPLPERGQNKKGLSINTGLGLLRLVALFSAFIQSRLIQLSIHSLIR